MGIAFLFAGLALSVTDGLHRAAKRVFMAGTRAVILSFLGLSIAYGLKVEYRFEVAAITIDWTVLIASARYSLSRIGQRSNISTPDRHQRCRHSRLAVESRR